MGLRGDGREFCEESEIIRGGGTPREVRSSFGVRAVGLGGGGTDCEQLRGRQRGGGAMPWEKLSGGMA